MNNRRPFIKPRTVRLPGIICPHCASTTTVRDSQQISLVARELRIRCDNDACDATYVAQLEVIRIIRLSATPRADVHLPQGNPNLGPKRPANDDHVIPANDQGLPVPTADPMSG